MLSSRRFMILCLFMCLVSALLSDCEAKKKKKKKDGSDYDPPPPPPPPPTCIRQHAPCTPGVCCNTFTCGPSGTCVPPPPGRAF